MSFDEIAVYRYALGADQDPRALPGRQGTRVRRTTHRGQDRRCAGHESGRAPRRNLDVGDRQVDPRYMSGQPPLDEISSATAAEAVDAVFFTARDGTLTFLDSIHRARARPTTPCRPRSTTTAPTCHTRTWSSTTRTRSLSNEWNVTRVSFGAVTQTASDSTSIARYFKRPSSVTGIPVMSDAECLDIATAMLAKYKDPITRITSITLLTNDPDVTEAVFRRDIGDRIRVFRTPPGGGSKYRPDVVHSEDPGGRDPAPAVEGDVGCQPRLIPFSYA